MQSAQVFLFSISKTSKKNQTRGIVAQKTLPWFSYWKITKILSPKNNSFRQGVTAPKPWQVPPVITGGVGEDTQLKSYYSRRKTKMYSNRSRNRTEESNICAENLSFFPPSNAFSAVNNLANSDVMVYDYFRTTLIWNESHRRDL